MYKKSFTFSSRALWCSNSDFRALRTSTSDDTPPVVAACRLTTVILNDLSCLATKHSKCSRRSCKKRTTVNYLIHNISHFSHTLTQARSQGLSSSRPRKRERGDPGWGWSRVSQRKIRPREGSFAC